MFTAKAKYGLKAMLYLATQPPKRRARLAEIAHSEHIPAKFLETILRELRNEGLVHAKYGPRGGYMLLVAPSDIVLGRFLRILDGSFEPTNCASETAYRRCDDCPDPATCKTRVVMRRLRQANASVLDFTTLAEIASHHPDLQNVAGSEKHFPTQTGGTSRRR